MVSYFKILAHVEGTSVSALCVSAGVYDSLIHKSGFSISKIM